MPTRFPFFLDWEINCQFAGLIWAGETGLFADIGLDVVWMPPSQDPTRSVLDRVLSGGVCAGCMEDNLIARAVAHAKGVKAIGATMQTTPMQLMTLPDSGIMTLADLSGRRIAMHADGIHLLETVVALHGVDATSVEVTVTGWALDDLVDGRFDAVQGYATTEPHALRRRGVEAHLIPIQHPDLRPWAQVMFAADAVIAEHRDVLARFVTACKTGWRAAMSKPDETAMMVAACSTEHDDPVENREILRLMASLVAGDRGLEHCVAMDPDRWRRNLETYARSGILSRELRHEEVVCDQFM